jgi:hypothetical protein
VALIADAERVLANFCPQDTHSIAKEVIAATEIVDRSPGKAIESKKGEEREHVS